MQKMLKPSTLKLLVLCPLIGALAGCGPKVAFECLPQPDHWSKRVSATIGSFANADDSIRYKLFSEVAPAKLDEAVTLLSQDDFVELTPQQAREYAQSVPASLGETKPYLVRALSSREESGSYAVDVYRNEIWVLYIIDNLTICRPENFHEALIVWLPEKPTAAYTSVHFAQE